MSHQSKTMNVPDKDDGTEKDKLSGHERQVNQRNQTIRPPSDDGYTGVPPDEQGQYGLRREDNGHTGSDERQEGGSTESEGKTESGGKGTPLPLNPVGNKEQGNKGSQGQEEDRDAPRRDNPYKKGDPRYEADFDRAGYGGPGVGSGKD